MILLSAAGLSRETSTVVLSHQQFDHCLGVFRVEAVQSPSWSMFEKLSAVSSLLSTRRFLPMFALVLEITLLRRNVCFL